MTCQYTAGHSCGQQHEHSQQQGQLFLWTYKGDPKQAAAHAGKSIETPSGFL